MKQSEKIAEFLNFLREVQQEYNIAVSVEKDKNDETQDVLHTIELEEINYHQYAKLSKGLHTVREERRKAKDTVTTLGPIVEWISCNTKTIRELERLLGEVRKAENSTRGRHYMPKTDIVQRLLGGEKITEEGTA